MLIRYNENIEKYKLSLDKLDILLKEFAEKIDTDTGSSKFSPDGIPRPFTGFTVIARVAKETELYRQLSEIQANIQEELNKLGIADHFAFLEPDSFHMTICDIDPSEQYPQTYTIPTPEQKNLRQKQLAAAFAEINFDQPLQGTVAELLLGGVLKYAVRFDLDDLCKIKTIENTIKKHTGASVRFFAGHISMAYLIQKPTREQLIEIINTLKQYELYPFEGFNIKELDFTCFKNMNSYETISTLEVK